MFRLCSTLRRSYRWLGGVEAIKRKTVFQYLEKSAMQFVPECCVRNGANQFRFRILCIKCIFYDSVIGDVECGPKFALRNSWGSK